MELDPISHPFCSSPFCALPTELKLEVCRYLTARDIIHLQLVRRMFHTFVDANSAHISSQICAREHTRLRKFINYHVTYEGDVSFLEAFSRWSHLRGWAGHATEEDGIADMRSIQAFALHWTPQKKYPDISERAHELTSELARLLREVHNQFHWPGTWNAAAIISVEEFKRCVSVLTADTGGTTDAACISIFEELRTTPGGRLSGPRRQGREMPDGTGNANFEDPIYAPDLRQSRLVRPRNPVSVNRWVSPQQAVEAFGVPKLPWTNQFTYVVRSDWAKRLLNSILDIRRLGQELDPLMVAAGLEELRIH